MNLDLKLFKFCAFLYYFEQLGGQNKNIFCSMKRSGWYSLTTTNTIFEIQKRVSLINFVELEKETHNPSKNATYFIISDLFQDKV